MGRHLRSEKRTTAGALRAFEEAIRLDPSHAPSWTGLAEITVLSAIFEHVPRPRGLRGRAKGAGDGASLQGESADGLHVEASPAWIERRWEAMEAAWRRAIELQPTHVLALGLFGDQPLHAPEARRGTAALRARAGSRSARLLPLHPHRRRLLTCGRPQEALPLPRGRARLREGGRDGAVLHRAWRRSPWGGSRKASRRGARLSRSRTAAAVLPRAPGMGARHRRSDRTKPARSSGSCERGRRLADGRLRGLAARRARGDRRGVRGARARRGGVPALALLHRASRLRPAARRPAIRGAVAAPGLIPVGSEPGVLRGGRAKGGLAQQVGQDGAQAEPGEEGVEGHAQAAGPPRATAAGRTASGRKRRLTQEDLDRRRSPARSPPCWRAP